MSGMDGNIYTSQMRESVIWQHITAEGATAPETLRRMDRAANLDTLESKMHRLCGVSSPKGVGGDWPGLFGQLL